MSPLGFPRMGRCWLSVLLPLLALSACGAYAVEPALITVEQVDFSVVTEPDLREIITEREDAPVEAAMAVPIGQSWFDGGALPALLMPPLAEVAFELPSYAPDALFSFAAGIHRTGYELDTDGRVRFEVEVDGALVFEASLEVGTEVPRADRRWHRGEVALAPRNRVTLRTIREGGSGAPVPAAFGDLQVSRRIEVLRTRASARRPNVVLILIDTLRADGLHVYGNPREVSPTLDGLAARGELYEDAYAPSPWTWPSTATLLTGQRPEEHGFVGPDSCHLDDGLTTLAEAFQMAGFTTAGFSCNPLVAPSKNLDQGFEVFRKYDWQPTRDVEDVVVAWLDEMGEYRFFLYLHLIEPHGPDDPDPDLVESMIPEDRREPVLNRKAVDRIMGKITRGEPHNLKKLLAQRDHALAFYDAEVVTVDRAVARLFDQMEQRGLLEQTIIAVTADHGEEFLDHGQFGHGGQLHEESVRVPLILAGPGVERGVRHPHRVEIRFLGQTLLELAGVEPPPGNLAGLGRLHDREGGPVFLSTETGTRLDPETGLRTIGRLQGVLHGDLALHWCPEERSSGKEWLRLYDLASDPEARRDIHEERPEAAAQLVRMIERYLEHAEELRPLLLGGGDAVRDELRSHGYLGGDDED